MKILLLHNKYQVRGGEDRVVESESALLREHGHEVIEHIVSNDSIRGTVSALKTARNLSFSEESFSAVSALLEKHKPTITHVHNFFPLLTPAVYEACQKHRIPVVQTLHNYRLTCANALLLRDGKPCELCIEGSLYNGARYACYRGSYLGSFALSHMLAKARRENLWNKKVDRFIALTNFAKEKFVQAGLAAEKIAVKSNFVKDPGRFPARKGGFALCVGRLSGEKGALTLLKAWEHISFPLKIIGDGELRDEVLRLKPANVEVLENRTHDEVLQEMANAVCLICPTECYEGAFPLVLIEAMAMRLPVVASRIGAIPEEIDGKTNGLLFTPGDPVELRAVVEEMLRDPARQKDFAEKARLLYEKKFTAEKIYRELLSVYESVLP